jgi:hypothetical protein
MVVELVASFSMLIGGMLLLWSVGAKGWGVAPWGFAAGTFVTVGVGFVQVATPLSGSPLLTMCVVVLAPLAAWVVARRQGRATRVPPLLTSVSLGVTAATVAVHHLLHTFAFHVDSLEYLGLSRLLVDNRYALAAIPDQIDKRYVAVSVLHAPAQSTGDYALLGITPLIAIAVMAIVAWMVYFGVHPYLGRRGALVVASIGVAALVTMNRFDFHAVYINGHLFLGLALLVTAGASWLLATGSEALGRAPAVIIALGVIALVLTRAEGVFLALAAIAPVIAASSIARATRAILLGTLGVSTTAWFAFASGIKGSRGYPMGTSGVMVAVGIAICVAAAVVAIGRLALLESKVPIAYEMGMLGIMLGMACVEPRILVGSLHATYYNAFGWRSVWGFCLTLLLVLMPIAMYAARGARLSALRMPLTMFFPIAVLLAYGRGSPYRVAAADSLNRMLIEVVPLTVAFVLIAAASPQTNERTIAQGKQVGVTR